MGHLNGYLTSKKPWDRWPGGYNYLAEYDFSIEHRPGRQHNNADAMSRIPCHQCLRPTGSMTDAEVDEAPEVPTKYDTETKSGGTSPAHTKVQTVYQAMAVPANWLEGMSSIDIRNQQWEDLILRKTISWLESGENRPTWEEITVDGIELKTFWGAWKQLCLRGTVLCRRWEDIRYLLVVPRSLRGEVLRQLHNSPTGGHLGMTKLVEKTHSRFYWPKMRESVRDWVRGCLECAKQKAPSKTKRAPLQQQIAGVPLECVAIDITGPFPTTEAGNRYIVVISDYFTKWTEAYPVPCITAETITNVLVNEFICRFGIPRTLHSDQGRQFESEVFQKTCALLGIDKTRTTPYHPQSDGQVERFNRTLKVMLSSYTSENQKDWDQHVPTVMMAYRASPQESTGLSPNMLMFGREVETFLSICFVIQLFPMSR